MFGNTYIRSKYLVKNDMGDIFTRQPKNYKDALDFDKSMDDSERQKQLDDMFNSFITQFANKALSKSGIKELEETGEVLLQPAVKEELGL